MKLSKMIGVSLVGSMLVIACATPNPNELVGGDDPSTDGAGDTATTTQASNPAPDMPKGKATSYSSNTASVKVAGPSGSSGVGEGLVGGAEAVPYSLGPGIFQVGPAVAYSNGSHYCIFQSFPDYTEATGRTDVIGVPMYAGFPGGMISDGACQIYYTGFFHFGFTFYGNGYAFCSCDHNPPPAREVARRPDGPYQGSCGGC